ncbi:Xyloglucan:xyloglucosyl transferase [Handroanthus impetiginosus]|uniref:Xyloglucan:xyloglucosyl transferase n=1 Tax=Handroanthus impetiginosus TaxID=429701 RepID=A0A2G9GQ88_9LAMI|nr:Xyloglucan:xyloglucosyl transferase [Handroanthus impetiginosus]
MAALRLIACIVALLSCTVSGRPATFLQDFRITWADSHIRQLEGGRAIQLVLDQSSGCGFASKYQYLFGRVSMKIKLVPGDSAGTVTAFYMNSDTDTIRDELDFEFLGNRTGQPYTVQTNVYAHGKGDREQRVNLWFDPAADFHTYSILWNHHHVIFYVDEVPIRVYKNNEARGIAFPKSQPMGPTHGCVLHSLGSRRLGHKRRTREDRLEQSPILFLLQGLRHRRLSSARARKLSFKPEQLVGGRRVPSAEPG